MRLGKTFGNGECICDFLYHEFANYRIIFACSCKLKQFANTLIRDKINTTVLNLESAVKAIGNPSTK